MISILKDIPPGWTKVKFGDIAQNVTERIDIPSDSGLEYYIGLEHLDTDQIRIKRYGSPDEVKATKYICKKGDIIFGKRRAYLRKLAVTERDAVASAHSMVLSPKGNLIYPNFLPCFMQSSLFWRTALAISEGSMSPTIKWKTLAKQEFLIPSLSEQKKISDVLWAIEDSATKAEQLVTVLDNFRIGILNHLLSRGIGHTKTNKTKIGLLPEGWSPSIFSKAILVNPRRTLKTGKKAEYVAMADLKENQQQITDKSYRTFKSGGSKFSNGDTLMARITPCLENGKTAFVDILDEELGFGSTEFIVLSGKENVTLNEYVYYLTISPRIRRAAIDSMRGTTGRQRVPNDFFDSIEIGVPPLDEQKQIVDIIRQLDQYIYQVKHNNVTHTNLKRKLTNEFMSGKLRIPPEALKNVQ